MEDNVLTEDAVAVDSLPVLREFLDDSPALELIEGKTGRLRVRGEFGRYDEATENKRLYPKGLWEREIGRLEPSFGHRKVFGELDHPTDGKTKLSRVSHIVTGLQVSPDGKVYGEAEILPTSRGRDLEALLRSGCRVGVSSRGYGSTKPDNRGYDVVQEDYKLVTFDFVADPADQNAYPEIVSEDVDADSGRFLFEGVELHMHEDRDEIPEVDEDASDLEALLDQARAEGKAEAEETLRERLATEVLDRMGELRASVEAQVREEVANDSALAAKASALDKIWELMLPYGAPASGDEIAQAQEAKIADLRSQLSERDERIEELEQACSKLEETARTAGYLCYLERAISGHPEADRVRRLVGDISEYTSADEFKERVDAVVDEIEDIHEQELAAEAHRREQHEEAQRERAALVERSEKLEEALEKALGGLRAAGLKLYGEQRLQKNPEAHKIRRVLETARLENKEDVDELIEDHRPVRKSREQMAEVSARLRKQFGGGYRGTPLDEEEPWPKERQRSGQPVTEDAGGYNGLPVTLEEIRPLLPPGA